MLRTLITPDGAINSSRSDSVNSGCVGPLRLLVVHHGNCRLAALAALLNDMGDDATGFATSDEARAWLESGDPPDVLITMQPPGGATGVMAFARECLARYDGLHVIYVAWLPSAAPHPLLAREHVLAAPFTANCLAAVIADTVQLSIA